MKKIKRWLWRINPYNKLKGARNEIRLLIEEREWLMKECERLKKILFNNQAANKSPQP